MYSDSTTTSDLAGLAKWETRQSIRKRPDNGDDYSGPRSAYPDRDNNPDAAPAAQSKTRQRVARCLHRMVGQFPSEHDWSPIGWATLLHDMLTEAVVEERLAWVETAVNHAVPAGAVPGVAMIDGHTVIVHCCPHGILEIRS